MSAKTKPFQQLTADAAQQAVRDIDKLPANSSVKRRPYAAVIIQKHAGIAR
jgi:hypothetical protein